MARVRIDEMLEAAGWVVQDGDRVDFRAGAGVAVREFMTPAGPMDYLLVAEGKVVGSLEAKAEGQTLMGVEQQADRYADGLEELVMTQDLPRYRDRMPFHYMSTGTETLFTSRRDPISRPREVFHFHRPQTLAKWAAQDHTFRARLRQMPLVKAEGLREIQHEAMVNLEASLHDDRPKALAAITMGAGKTMLAVAETYRLLRFGGAERILFLVDRVSLGDQAANEFTSFVSPDDGRRFGDLFGVQVLRSNNIDPAANVIVCTIQRLYAMLRDQERADNPEFDEVSSFELEDGEPVEVAYQPTKPVELFDLIYIDECHRSIYGRWGQVLDYFDAFQVGLTATETPATLAYFDDNLIAQYSQEESVIAGINVDQSLYRIRTEVGESGSTIEAGDWVDVRDKQTRAIERRQMDDELIYEPSKLDRAVLNKAQIRQVVRTFKERVTTEIFPGRDEVPKTIFFAKHDHHAEDVLRIIREEFGRGSDFARKITYKAEGTVQENVNRFRNDPQLRIAVTVEQIGTGTDVKAVECLVFMRMVGSRVLLNQMRGRAVRTMSKDDFQAVTPGAFEKNQTKQYSVLVDAVGITEEEIVLKDTNPLESRPNVPLAKLLGQIGMGLTGDDNLRSVAKRLVLLNGKLTDVERAEFAEAAAGRGLQDIAAALRQAADPDVVVEVAREAMGAAEDDEDVEPSAEQLKAARNELVDEAIDQLRTTPVRDKIEELQRSTSEVLIHLGGQDSLVSAGFIDDPVEVQSVVDRWKSFIDTNHEEFIALKAYYSQPYERRPSLEDIKELAAAISRPPLELTPEKLWSAYEALDASRVKGHGGKLDIDLVRIIRYTLERDEELIPHEAVVSQRFAMWMHEQQAGGREFSAEQVRWLEMVRDHIASSMTFDPNQDYDFPPFSEEGGIVAADGLFGKALNTVVDELNEALAAG